MDNKNQELDDVVEEEITLNSEANMPNHDVPNAEDNVVRQSSAFRNRNMTFNNSSNRNERLKSATNPNSGQGNRVTKKIVNPTNHQRPDLGVQKEQNTTTNTDKKSNDVGSRNLQASLANRAKNIINNRRKRQKESSDTSTDESTSDTSGSEEKNFTTDDMLAKTKQKVKVKVIIYASIAGIFILLFFAIVLAILGVDISATVPAINQGSYGTEDFTPTYEVGTKEYEEEIKYYKKLKGAAEDYLEEYGEELKTEYVHAVLIYLYYRIDNVIDDDEKTIPVDYAKMSSMVYKIIELMKPADSNDSIDYEKGGEFYNNLKRSEDFQKYYEDVLKDKYIIDLLDEIFDLGEELSELKKEDETVITQEIEVTIPPSDSTKPEEAKKITITDYLAYSIYANSASITNPELVKAYTIAYSTNLVTKNKKLSIDSNNASMYNNICNISLGCSYNSEEKLVDGGGERSNRNTIFYKGKYYYKQPLTEQEQNKLNSDIKAVFGNVLVKTDGTYPQVELSKLNEYTASGLNYKGILNNAYGDYEIKNIGEGSYILDASYGDKRVLVDVNMYDQSDYKVSFCGLKKETIASSGCGVTSMAIVLSTYENNKTYDPLWNNDLATKNGNCGAGRGTDYAHFTNVAAKLGYSKPTIYVKSKASGWKISKAGYNNILKNLSQGNLVIVNVVKGHFTGGGHYMVLGGIDPATKKVYVYDTNNKNNKKNRGTGSGWYSFNDIIAPESKAFIIIKKKG